MSLTISEGNFNFLKSGLMLRREISRSAFRVRALARHRTLPAASGYHADRTGPYVHGGSINATYDDGGVYDGGLMSTRAFASCSPLGASFKKTGQHKFLQMIASSSIGIDERGMASDAYDATQIQVLQGLDPVRKRPGMYIGSTGQRGLHHLIYEILDNAIDEVQAGHASNVWVEMDMESDWITIRDDGRGIPTDIHPVTGKSALETVLTVLHAGGKFGGDSSGYSVSGGLHGVGVSVVNALSRDMQVTVWRGGKRHDQHFSKGEAKGPLSTADVPDDDGQKGTRVRFLYDDTIFSNTATFDPETIRSRLRELAFLNPSATINFRVKGETPKSSSKKKRKEKMEESDDETVSTSDEWEIFHFSGGLEEYVKHINRDRLSSHEPITFSHSDGDVQVHVSLQWCSDVFSDTLIGFVNSIKTIDGGTHMDGFKSALTRTGMLLL